MSDILNQTKTFSLIEQRIAKTLSANPRYIAWGASADLSPVGREAVRAVYEDTIVKGETRARQCRPNRPQSS